MSANARTQAEGAAHGGPGRGALWCSVYILDLDSPSSPPAHPDLSLVPDMVLVVQLLWWLPANVHGSVLRARACPPCLRSSVTPWLHLPSPQRPAPSDTSHLHCLRLRAPSLKSAFRHGLRPFFSKEARQSEPHVHRVNKIASRFLQRTWAQNHGSSSHVLPSRGIPSPPCLGS